MALAPVLAIVAYFLLYQGQAAPNIYTVAIVSFVVGLITKDFVDRLEDFGRQKLGNTDESSKDTETVGSNKTTHGTEAQ